MTLEGKISEAYSSYAFYNIYRHKR